jgi:hypothetical protein
MRGPADNVGDLIAGMARTGFRGSRPGESVEGRAGTIRDPDCAGPPVRMGPFAGTIGNKERSVN